MPICFVSILSWLLLYSLPFSFIHHSIQPISRRCSRMSRLKVCISKLDISARHFERFVSQEPLKRKDTSSTSKELDSEGMAECMWGRTFALRIRESSVAPDHFCNIITCQFKSGAVLFHYSAYEEITCLRSLSHKSIISDGQISRQKPFCVKSKVYGSFLISFSVDKQTLTLKFCIIISKSTKLLDTHSSVIQKHYYGCITSAIKSTSFFGCLNHCFDFGRVKGWDYYLWFFWAA